MNIFYHVIFQILKLRLAESCPDILQVYTVHLTRDCCSFHVWLRSVRFAHNSAQKWVCVKVQHSLSAPDSPKLTLYHKWLLLILANPFVNRLHNITFWFVYILFYKMSYCLKSHDGQSLAFWARDLACEQTLLLLIATYKSQCRMKSSFPKFRSFGPRHENKNLESPK